MVHVQYIPVSFFRWTSRENLLIHVEEEEEEDPQLFVALYDFQSGGENQLSLKKGEQVSRNSIVIKGSSESMDGIRTPAILQEVWIMW